MRRPKTLLVIAAIIVALSAASSAPMLAGLSMPLVGESVPSPAEIVCIDTDHDGFTTCDGDCNDADARICPHAPELCDGKDNQCPGGLGYGELDEAADAHRDGVSNCDDNYLAVPSTAQADSDGIVGATLVTVAAGTWELVKSWL